MHMQPAQGHHAPVHASSSTCFKQSRWALKSCAPWAYAVQVYDQEGQNVLLHSVVEVMGVYTSAPHVVRNSCTSYPCLPHVWPATCVAGGMRGMAFMWLLAGPMPWVCAECEHAHVLSGAAHEGLHLPTAMPDSGPNNSRAHAQAVCRSRLVVPNMRICVRKWRERGLVKGRWHCVAC